MLSKNALTVLFQLYIQDAEDQIESDGFLPNLDVTNKAATELLNDIILYGTESNRIEDDTPAKVVCTDINMHD